MGLSSFPALIYLLLPNSWSFKLFLGRSQAPREQYKVTLALTLSQLLQYPFIILLKSLIVIMPSLHDLL